MLVHVNNTSIDAALEFISGSEQVQVTTNLSCVQPETSSSNNLTKQTSCQLSSTTASQVAVVEDFSSSVSHKKIAAKSEVINIPNPVFCRDGVSTVLESMYDKAGVKTQHEAMFVILHALMLESGFQSEVINVTIPIFHNHMHKIHEAYVYVSVYYCISISHIRHLACATVHRINVVCCLGTVEIRIEI